jgi:hypothetical protein
MTLRTLRQEVSSATIAYTVATWDDETGNAELLEYDRDGRPIRRLVLNYRSEDAAAPAAPGDQIGEAIWYAPSGIELQRRPILEP